MLLATDNVTNWPNWLPFRKFLAVLVTVDGPYFVKPELEVSKGRGSLVAEAHRKEARRTAAALNILLASGRRRSANTCLVSRDREGFGNHGL